MRQHLSIGPASAMPPIRPIASRVIFRITPRQMTIRFDVVKLVGPTVKLS